MRNSVKDMDEQEQQINKLVEDINPRADNFPSSLAEATTAPLADDELGGTASKDNVQKNNKS